MSADKGRVRERILIRDQVDTISRGASAELPFEERSALYTIEALEQIALAICNLAETIDARGEVLTEKIGARGAGIRDAMRDHWRR
jgi:hypothetical protein